MSSRKALIKIHIQGRNDVFLMSEYESEKNLTLKILDIKENESFVGQASDLDLRTQAARVRLTFRDYLNQALKALFQTSVEKCNYIYSLEKGENYVFKWKSIDQEETVINLGSVEMTKQDHVSVLERVLLCLSKEVVELHLKMEKYAVDLAECKNQTANALNQLSEAVDVKENLEKEMFAKFLLVLNEKKRMLKQQRSFSQQSNSANHKAPKIKKMKLHEVSDSSEDEADEFQDVNRAGPSSSKKRNSLLFSDDDEGESVVPVRQSKMRNRKAGNKRRSSSDEVITTRNELETRNIIDDDSDDFLLGNL